MSESKLALQCVFSPRWLFIHWLALIENVLMRTARVPGPFVTGPKYKSVHLLRTRSQESLHFPSGHTDTADLLLLVYISFMFQVILRPFFLLCAGNLFSLSLFSFLFTVQRHAGQVHRKPWIISQMQEYQRQCPTYHLNVLTDGLFVVFFSLLLLLIDPSRCGAVSCHSCEGGF